MAGYDTDTRGERAFTELPDRQRSIGFPAALIGVGIGGLVDGIVFHQILQWHHFLSSAGSDRIGLDPRPVDTVAGLETNVLWDGIFHVVPWVLLVIGLAILFARVSHERRQVFRSRELWGWVLVGWGAFNLIEGFVAHQLIGLHHVRPGPDELIWDLGWLAAGGLMMLLGWFLAWTGGFARRRQQRHDAEFIAERTTPTSEPVAFEHQEASPAVAQPGGTSPSPAYQQESTPVVGRADSDQSSTVHERRGGSDRRTQVLSGDQVPSERRTGRERRLTPVGR